MISLKTGKEIAEKEFSEFPIGRIIDIGEMWAFCFDSGEIGYLPVPPIENLDIIENGKVIYSAV